MNKSAPFRIFYYESPRYDENGDLLYPEPVLIARQVSEAPLGLRWIRRRLGLRAYGQLIEGCRFRDEILPLPDPVNPSALSTTQASAKLTSATPAASQSALAAAPAIDQPALATDPRAPLLDLPSPPAMTIPEEDVPALSVANLDQRPTAKPVEKITFADEDLLLPTPVKHHLIDLDSLSATVATEIEPAVPEPLPDLTNPSSESPVDADLPTDSLFSPLLGAAESSLAEPLLEPAATKAEDFT